MFELMLRQAPEEQWDIVYPVDDEWPSAECMASYQVGTYQPLLGEVCGKRSHKSINQLTRQSLDHQLCIGFTALCGHHAQAIAVTGSPLDAFDSVPWIVRLRRELATASQRGQRLLGICFGCQALAIALGGDAGVHP